MAYRRHYIHAAVPTKAYLAKTIGKAHHIAYIVCVCTEEIPFKAPFSGYRRTPDRKFLALIADIANVLILRQET